MQSTVETADKPLGVIDSLQQGFDLINRRPWLLIIPFLVDLLLWRGPKLSITPLIDRGIDLISGQTEIPAELAQNTNVLIEGLRASGQNFNLLSLLAGTITGLPSYLARPDAAAAVAALSTSLQLDDIRQTLLYTILLIPAGLLIGGLWLTTLVYAIDNERSGLGNALRHSGWIWLNAGMYLVGLIVALLAASGIFALFASLFMLLAGGAGMSIFSLLMVLFIWGIMWIAIGLTFVISAIALDGVNVAQAVWRSVNVVGRNLTSTMGLLILTLVLSEGFARIWTKLGSSTWAISLGIVGTAYIGAALTAATLFFYRGRYLHWQRIRSAMANARRQQADEHHAS